MTPSQRRRKMASAAEHLAAATRILDEICTNYRDDAAAGKPTDKEAWRWTARATVEATSARDTAQFLR